MNKLDRGKRIQVLSALVEGASLRAVSRMTGVARNTITSLLMEAGAACAAYIAEMGYTEHTVEQLVLFRAGKALDAGCDGVIASGREAKKIKELSGGKLLVVTPGIRPEGYPVDDQKRSATPRDAVLAGADYLVIGRPITEPPGSTPRKAAEATLEEMQAAFDERTR